MLGASVGTLGKRQRETDTQTGIQTDRHTGRQTDRHTRTMEALVTPTGLIYKKGGNRTWRLAPEANQLLV